MQLLPRFALLSLLISPAALAEQLYRVEMVLFHQASPSPSPAGQPAPDDQASGAVRLGGSQRLQPVLGLLATHLSRADGYSIEPGKLTYLDHHGLGWLIEVSAL